MAERMTYGIEDFSGGLTDYPLNADPNQMSDLKNTLIDPNKKAFSRPGSELFSEDFFKLPTLSPTRVTGMFYYDGVLFATDGKQIFYGDGTAAPTELLGPTGNPLFDSGTDDDVLSITPWNNHVYINTDRGLIGARVFKDGSNAFQLRTQGLPQVGLPTITPNSAGTSHSYLYAFIYRYDYQVKTVTFVDLGAPRYSTVVQTNNNIGTAPHQVNITAIPVLTNTVNTNYDTSTIKVDIYRTIDGGTEYFKVGTVTNGTTTYTDTTTQSVLLTAEQLYTNGGVVSNTQPLPAKATAVVNGKMYYVAPLEGSERLDNCIAESLQDDPDSVPSTFRTFIDDNAVGVAGYNGLPLVFGTTRVYRIEGEYNEINQGNTLAREISANAGCVSHNSIVAVRGGVVWAGNDGFYYTDGYNFLKISETINLTYKKFILDAERKKRIVGAYDRQENRVYWSVYKDANSTDVDAVFVLDLLWGFTPTSTFTYWENGVYFAPTFIVFNETSNLIRGDSRGYIFKHSDSVYTDPRLDVTKAPDEWGTRYIPWNIQTCSIDGGMPAIRKWGIQVLTRFENLSNLAVQINSINDDNPIVAALTPIRYWLNCLWGDPDTIWGDNTIRWNWTGLIEQRRRLPAGTIRFSYKQLQVTNGYVPIYNSDVYGVANVDGNAKTVTTTDLDWPDNLLDYFICFAYDNYTQQFPISERTSDTVLTVLDPGNKLLTAGSEPWLIKGYPKNQAMSLQSLILYFAPMSATQPTYYGTGVETGDNG